MAIAPKAAPGGQDAEALFQEARRLRRRRRLVAGGAVAMAAALAAVAVVVAGAGGARKAPRSGRTAPAGAPRGPAPAVNAGTMRGHGTVAFVSRGRLWVLDGSTGSLREVSQGSGAADPQFSADGKWLAFAAGGRVWVAKSDGTGPRPVPGSQAGGGPTWSPNGDLLAADVGIVEVTSRGALRILTRQAGDGTWSPDGSRVAFVTTRHKAEWLEEIPARGGRPVTWYRSPFQPAIRSQHVPAVPNRITVAAVLPGSKGLLYWFDPDSAEAADGQALYLIKAPGQRPIRVGATLTGPGSVAVSPTGEFAIVNGLNRYAWQTKTLELCSPVSAACARVRAPRRDVTLDPAWSPDGSRLAFVEAPASSAVGFPQNVVARWYATHMLWLLRSPGQVAQRITGSNGATAPVWSATGKSLMYEAGDAVWLVPALPGPPVRIAAPLFPVSSWPTYYGEVNWAQQFAWSAGR